MNVREKFKGVFAVVSLAALLPFVASGAASDRVIEIFTDLSRVPRYSGNETRIGDWLMAWAETRGFKPTRDTAGCGNVIFDVPGTEGRENTSLVILQVHQDMVRATKDGVEHDWARDPVIVDKTDGWLHAKDHETSLGADDGIGLAMVLAIAEGGMAHGPLRVIATVEKETTQTGVKGLDPKWTKGAMGLINVDGETEGEVAISSAGLKAWMANPDGRLVELADEVYRSAFGKHISIVATPAGLECGALAAKNPALDMISVGPTVQDPHTVNERCEVASIDRVWTLLEGVLLKVPAPIDLPMPVITSFTPEFTQGPTSEVPNVSWTIQGPFDRVALTIDETTVYDGDTRCGEGRWRELSRPGTHRLRLSVGYGDKEVVDSCFYTALLEGDEPAALPQIGYFYPDYYVGHEGTAPLVHWEAKNVTSLEIWVNETCVLMSQDAVGEHCLSQLRTPGSYVVRLVVHNVVDDAEASFCYRCEASEPPVLSSAPLLRSAGSAPVIRTFEPDAYDASIWETPSIHWNLDGKVDSLELKIDNIPVFKGDGKAGCGRWLDLSLLNIGEANGVHDATLSVSNAFGVVTSNFTCTCHWAPPPPPPMGSEGNPWRIGDDVQAYTNGSGGLVIVGEGATSNFTGAASLPWAEVAGEITSASVPDSVTAIGDNLWAGFGDGVLINGETIASRRRIAAGFPVEPPAGEISGGVFERIEIIAGKAVLAVGVYTNAELTATSKGWGKAAVEDVAIDETGTAVLTVAAPADRGFMIIRSKRAK